MRIINRIIVQTSIYEPDKQNRKIYVGYNAVEGSWVLIN